MSYIGQEVRQGRAQRTTFTATGGETSVAVGYDPGQLSVYLNGVKLINAVDFTATNGTSITGLTALAANDVMDFVSLDNFLADDSVSAASGGTFAGMVTYQSVTNNPATLLNDVTAPVNYSTAITGPVTIDADLIINGNVTVLTDSKSN